MPLPAQTQVLIVGAGPTGMACALTLAGLGLQVTLVDAYPNNRNGSRSIVIHAHTLEVLKTVGLAEPLMETGIQSDRLSLRKGTTKLLDVDIGQLRDDTEFPVVLLIPQHEVERILREKLSEAGVEILRPHTVVGIKDVSSQSGLDVTFDDGSIVRSQYLVGADGSRSTVRRLANIDFKDPGTGIDYDGKIPPSSTFQLALADVYFKEPLPTFVPRDTISFDLENFFFMCPLRSREEAVSKDVSYWRIGIGIPSNASCPRNPDIAFLQADLDERLPMNSKPHLDSVETSSRYRVRAAVASTLFKKIGEGNILLVGDAAHVHSPAGGQGLNLGLCDAVALAQVIHAHINANSKVKIEERSDFLLTEYSRSRLKVALRIVGMAQGLTHFVNSRSGWRKVLRDMVFWVVGRVPFLGRALAWRISGLSNRD